VRHFSLKIQHDVASFGAVFFWMVAIFAQEPWQCTSGAACRRAGAKWCTGHGHGEANGRASFGGISLVA